MAAQWSVQKEIKSWWLLNMSVWLGCVSGVACAAMNQRSVYSTLIQQKGESLYGEGRKQGTEGEVKQTGDIKPTHHSRIMAVVKPTDWG